MFLVAGSTSNGIPGIKLILMCASASLNRFTPGPSAAPPMGAMKHRRPAPTASRTVLLRSRSVPRNLEHRYPVTALLARSLDFAGHRSETLNADGRGIDRRREAVFHAVKSRAVRRLENRNRPGRPHGGPLNRWNMTRNTPSRPSAAAANELRRRITADPARNRRDSSTHSQSPPEACQRRQADDRRRRQERRRSASHRPHSISGSSASATIIRREQVK